MIGLQAVMVASLLSLVICQAPGDESELCTVILPSQGQNVLNDPPTVRPLMDSRHYKNLLEPNTDPVWQRLNLDNNNGGGGTTEWIQQGGSCTHQVIVCGYDEGLQDNWLITQHINTMVDGTPLSQVTVQFEYQQTGCPTGDANACLRVFDVYKHETSIIDPAAARDTNNYVFVESLTTQITSGQETQTATVDITLNTQESGFYLAVRDTGTCVLFSRVLVFCYVCPPTTIVGLATGPETIAPVGTTPLQVPATCVENASPANGGAVSLTCLQQGIWLSSAGGCECDNGFVLSSTQEECIRCNAGFYANTAIGECMLCPNNSNSTEPGLAECLCDSGYYRVPGEPDEPCYLPPSPPRNVMAKSPRVSQTSTSVTLSWDEPLSTGGRSRDELRYNLWYREVGSSDTVLVGTVYGTMGNVTGLSPGIPYELFVSADTNITSQIPISFLENRSAVIILKSSPPTTTASEQPATEQPATEQPATEQPATEQPATEQPATEAVNTLALALAISITLVVASAAVIIVVLVCALVFCFRRKTLNIEATPKAKEESAIDIQSNLCYTTSTQVLATQDMERNYCYEYI